jgi:hypothetical protein
VSKHAVLKFVGLLVKVCNVLSLLTWSWIAFGTFCSR